MLKIIEIIKQSMDSVCTIHANWDCLNLFNDKGQIVAYVTEKDRGSYKQCGLNLGVLDFDAIETIESELESSVHVKYFLCPESNIQDKEFDFQIEARSSAESLKRITPAAG